MNPKTQTCNLKEEKREEGGGEEKKDNAKNVLQIFCCILMGLPTAKAALWTVAALLHGRPSHGTH